MVDNAKPILALAMGAALLLSGCIGNGTDDLSVFTEDEASASGQENVRVLLTATNVSSTEIAHVGFQLDGVFLHEAETPLPKGYHDLDVLVDHADVVSSGSSVSAVVANGSLPAGNYDQLMLRLGSVEVQKASAGSNSSSGGHGHGGHDHGSGGGHGDADGNASSSSEASKIPGGDLPIDLSFEAVEGEVTQIKLALDVAASTSSDGFTPTIEATATRGGQTLAETTVSLGDKDAATNASTPKPAARMVVFAPNGDQVYKPGFTVEQGVFINSKSSAFKPGVEVRFSGTESEAVAKGATIASYTWDFDDGSTATGPTVAHAFDQPGVFEVALTVTDTKGVSADHMVRVVVSGWTTQLTNTSFESEGDWTASASSTSLSTWAPDGPGHTGSTSWHVGTHAHDACPEAGPSCSTPYTPGANATLVSPEFTVPANWTSAGFFFWLSGASEAGFDVLTVSYTADGNRTVVGEFSGEQGWTEIGGQASLDDAIGKTVQFQFRFTSDFFTQEGTGWYLDDLVIGGVDVPLHKAHLLEAGGHGGHDHSH